MTTLGFSTLFVAMVAHGLGETARDALFLAALPSALLPWAYLAITALVLALLVVERRLLRRGDRRHVLGGTMFVSGLGYVVFGHVLAAPAPSELFALYVFTGLVSTLVVVQQWQLLAASVSVSVAKRTFATVGAGAAMGAVVGSVAAERLLAYGLEVRHLPTVAGVALMLASIVAIVWPSPEHTVFHEKRAPKTAAVLRLSYLRRLLALVVLGTIVATGVQFLLKSTVAQEVAANELGPFFARLYLALNLLGVVMQLLVGRFILRRFGVHRALAILPLATLALALVAVVGPFAFGAVLALRAADGAFRPLYRTSAEMLYLPLPGPVRERFKGLIDAVGQRGGQAVASVILLAALAVGATHAHLLIGVGALAGVWSVVAVSMRRPYLALFRESLRRGAMGRDGTLDRFELHTLEALLGALDSEHDEEALASLELFRSFRRADLVPRLVLYHPSPVVAERALELFVESGDRAFLPIARRLLRDGAPPTRAAALRALIALDEKSVDLRALVRETVPEVHAAALVALLTRHPGDPELDALMETCLARGDVSTRSEVARVMGLTGAPVHRKPLLRLLEAPEPEVRIAAARGLQRIPLDEDSLRRLTRQLGDGTVRSAARGAIASAGERALAVLDAAFDDPTLSRRIRRHLPRTVTRFPSVEALKLLERRLASEVDGAVRFKVLRALGQLVHEMPQLRVDRSLLQATVRESLARAVELASLRLTVEASDRVATVGHGLLIQTLAEKEEHALERTFRLLDILRPREEFLALWRNLRGDDPKARAAAIELLEHAVDGPTRRALVALTCDRTIDSQSLELAATALGVALPDLEYVDRLALALRDPSEGVRSLAAYHIAELGLVGLRAELRDIRPRISSAFVVELVDRAIAHLDVADEVSDGT